MQGPSMADARSWIEKWQGALAMMAFLGVGLHNQYSVLPAVRRAENSADSQYGAIKGELKALNDRVGNLEGFQARADRVNFAELVLGCANRRINEAECNARLPAEIRDVMIHQPKGR